MKTVSILGCGWLGRPLALSLKELGYQVKGSTRSIESARKLDELGIESYRIDIEQAIDPNSSFFDSEITIVCLTGKNLEAHNRLSQLLGRKRGLKQVFYTSSTSVYQPSKAVVTEDSLLNEDNKLVEIEQYYLNAFQTTTILRLAGLVGPDRHPGRFFRNRLDIALPDVPANLIHLEQVIESILFLIKHPQAQEIYNVVADEHPSKFHFYSAAFEDYFNKKPSFTLKSPTEYVGYKLISNEKLRRLSGIEFSLFGYYDYQLPSINIEP